MAAKILKFNCPKCEEPMDINRIMERLPYATYSNETIVVQDDGEIELRWSFEANQDQIHFECQRCGTAIRSANGEKITDEKELVEFLKQQETNCG